MASDKEGLSLSNICDIINQIWWSIWSRNTDVFLAIRLKDHLHHLLYTNEQFDPCKFIYGRKTTLEYAITTLLRAIAIYPTFKPNWDSLDITWLVLNSTMAFPKIGRTNILHVVLRLSLFQGSETSNHLSPEAKNFVTTLHIKLALLANDASLSE